MSVPQLTADQLRARILASTDESFAGYRSAAGLRMTPADPASTVGRVDIWADPSSGLPLMVEVFGRGSGRPACKACSSKSARGMRISGC